jgi:hypothetical protein
MVRTTYRMNHHHSYPSNNRWGIPELTPDRCIFPGKKDVVMYGSQRFDRVDCTDKVLGFYVCDYRFENLWNYYQRVVDAISKYRFLAVIEPDYSMWVDRPLVEQVWAVYKTRWIGRYMQDCGINVIPNLNWAGPESYEFAWLGIPQGVPMVAVETQSCGDNVDAFNQGLAAGCEIVKPKRLLVYGNKKSWVRIPKGVECIYVKSFISKLHKES